MANKLKFGTVTKAKGKPKKSGKKGPGYAYVQQIRAFYGASSRRR